MAMNNFNKKLRILPIIGITLTLAGYLFLTFQTFKLNERKKLLISEIEQLESIKSRLTAEVKVKDTIITLQDSIIFQSSDQETVEKGIELKEKIKGPVGNYFTVTSKENSDIEMAQKFEDEGFNYLFEKDVDKAIISFRMSENSLNGYHMVYDISKYLNNNKERLSDKNSEFWKEAYQKILKDFSWKMPAETKSKLVELTK